MLAVSATRTDSAVRAEGNPTSIANRVCLSTNVAIAERPALPMIRSPSQWPGTALSSTSAGRSAIRRCRGCCRPSGFPAPFGVGGPCGAPSRVLVATPRATGHIATGRSSRATRASPGRQGSRAEALQRSAAATTAPPAAAQPRHASADSGRVSHASADAPARAPAHQRGPPGIPRGRRCVPARATPSSWKTQPSRDQRRRLAASGHMTIGMVTELPVKLRWRHRGSLPYTAIASRRSRLPEAPDPLRAPRSRA
jgi:hypothetical protein